jgi:hypothetical protein
MADFDILRSVSFSPSGLNQTVATYHLDQNATSVFIHAKGDAATGMVQIVGSDDDTLMNAGNVKNGTIRVDVIMRTAYNETKALVCKMQKEDGGQGVGVYVSLTYVGSSLPANRKTSRPHRLLQQPRVPPTRLSRQIPISRSSSSSDCLTSRWFRNYKR